LDSRNWPCRHAHRQGQHFHILRPFENGHHFVERLRVHERLIALDIDHKLLLEMAMTSAIREVPFGWSQRVMNVFPEGLHALLDAQVVGPTITSSIFFACFARSRHAESWLAVYGTQNFSGNG